MMVNNIGLRNRVVQSSSSSVGASVGSGKTAVEGNQGTVVAMSTGKVQTCKNARGFVLAKASEINVDELLFDCGKRYHPQEGLALRMVAPFLQFSMLHQAVENQPLSIFHL
jgi:hypothetical protein